MSSEKENDGLNVTIENTDGGSLYVPTPERECMCSKNSNIASWT